MRSSLAKEIIKKSAPVLSTLLIWQVAQGAFTYRTKRHLKKRVVKEFGELTSEEAARRKEDVRDIPLEAAHFNHDRGYHNYNHPDNGRYITMYEHYIEHCQASEMPNQLHLPYSERKMDNGLSRHQNNSAIELQWLSQQVFEYILFCNADDFEAVIDQFFTKFSPVELTDDQIYECVEKSIHRFEGYRDLPYRERESLKQRITQHKRSLGLAKRWEQRVAIANR